MAVDDLSTWARTDGLEIVLLVLGAVLLHRAFDWVARRVESHLNIASDELGAPLLSDRDKHAYALVQAGVRLAVALLWFVTVLLVLMRLGLPMSVLVGPATAAGVALGLGGQKIVGDLLSGFFLISERQYGVGDIVQVMPPGGTDGIIGTVEEVTLRVTRLRTAGGDVVAIPNGEIRQLVNRSKDWSRVIVDVPVPIGEDLDAASSVLQEVAEELRADDHWGPLLLGDARLLGVESADLAKLQLRITVRTLPGRQWEVSRELRRRAVHALQQAGILTVEAA